MRRFLLTACVAVVALSGVASAPTSAANTIPSPYKVQGSLNRIESTPGSTTLWASKMVRNPRVVSFKPGTGWTPYTMPGGETLIWDIAMASESNGWAVSSDQLYHWNGTGWVARNPAAMGDDAAFGEIGLSGPNDVWITGWHLTEDTGYVPALWHYNGNGWQELTYPVGPGEQISRPLALSPTDVWLIGRRQINGEDRAFTLHWNGTTWTEVPVPPSIAPNDDLTASSPNSIWGTLGAVGESDIRLVHWDGTEWSETVQPPDWLGGPFWIDALPGGDVWGVGWAVNNDDYLMRTDGTSWQRWKVPDRCEFERKLSIYDVKVVSAHEVYVVGLCQATYEYTVAMRFNGTSWTRV